MTEAEYEELVRKKWGETLLVVNRKVSPREDAEDIVLEVFAKLWKHKDNLNPDKILNWLGKVTRTTVVDYHRRRKENMEPLYKAEDQVDKRNLSDPLYSFLVKEEIHQAITVMKDALTERQELVIHLSFGQGKGPTEIGPLIGVSAGAAAQYRNRALANLRSMMRGDDGCCPDDFMA